MKPVTRPESKNHLLDFTTGPFNVRINTDYSGFVDCFKLLYGVPAARDNSQSSGIYHYQIDMLRPGNVRRYIKPQIELLVDSIHPFEPYPLHHHFPLFEWGMNWIIAMTAHQYLLLHSAVLEYQQAGCIFPALPGSGKSTLCASLAYNGWRLLSDEFGIVNYRSGMIMPMPRTIGLKNESIPAIKEFLPEAVMGPLFYKTRKGTVAHLAPTRFSLDRQHRPSTPRLIIFPKFSQEPACVLKSIDKSLAFTRLSNNSFNYHVSMRQGFKALSRLIEQCDCYSFEYHRLDQAVETLTGLMHEKYL